jgi:hypothetical protein
MVWPNKGKKKSEAEVQLELKVEELNKQLRKAQDTIGDMQRKRDSPSVSTTASSTLVPVGHKGYLFRWLVRTSMRSLMDWNYTIFSTTSLRVGLSSSQLTG